MNDSTIVKREEGFHLSYKVCEIEDKEITIGYDGESVVVGGTAISKEEFRNFEITEKQLKILGIPEKKFSYFRSQLPSISHLDNIFQQKKQNY